MHRHEHESGERDAKSTDSTLAQAQGGAHEVGGTLMPKDGQPFALL